MSSYKIKHAWGLPALALIGLVLALAPTAWAGGSQLSGPAAPSVTTGRRG